MKWDLTAGQQSVSIALHNVKMLMIV